MNTKNSLPVFEGRTVISPQGYNVHADDWQKVVWGDQKKQLLGRAPYALWVSLKEKEPPLFLWNTGASQKNGLKEASYTRNYVLEHMLELPKQFPTFFAGTEKKLLSLKKHLQKHNTLLLEEISYNTRESMFAMGIMLNHIVGLEEVIIISSDNHTPRCMRDGLVAFHATMCRFSQIRFQFEACHTSYADKKIDDVIIRDLGD